MKVSDPDLTPRPAELDRAVSWEETGDPVYLYTAVVESETWTVRINDFPEQQLYTLFRGDREAGSFDDWPSAWLRPGESAHSGGPIPAGRRRV